MIECILKFLYRSFVGATIVLLVQNQNWALLHNQRKLALLYNLMKLATEISKTLSCLHFVRTLMPSYSKFKFKHWGGKGEQKDSWLFKLLVRYVVEFGWKAVGRLAVKHCACNNSQHAQWILWKFKYEGQVQFPWPLRLVPAITQEEVKKFFWNLSLLFPVANWRSSLISMIITFVVDKLWSSMSQKIGLCVLCMR